TLQVVATITVASWPAEVAISPTGNRVYVTHATVGANQVDVIGASTNQVVAVVRHGLEGGSYPVGVAVSRDGTRVYAGSFHTVAVIDAGTMQVTASVRV